MLKTSINKRRSLAPLLFICLLLTLGGCEHVGPFVEPVDPGGIPEGPGLFSGESGTVYENKNSTPTISESEELNGSDANGFNEFKAYQRWKSEERYSDEYKEFQEWMRYKKWKSEQ